MGAVPEPAPEAGGSRRPDSRKLEAGAGSTSTIAIAIHQI